MKGVNRSESRFLQTPHDYCCPVRVAATILKLVLYPLEELLSSPVEVLAGCASFVCSPESLLCIPQTGGYSPSRLDGCVLSGHACARGMPHTVEDRQGGMIKCGRLDKGLGVTEVYPMFRLGGLCVWSVAFLQATCAKLLSTVVVPG